MWQLVVGVLLSGTASELAMADAPPAAVCGTQSFEDCIERKRLEYRGRGAIGLLWIYQADEKAEPGREQVHLLIDRVAAGSVAAGAGLEKGDVIVGLDGASLRPLGDRAYTELFDALRAGTELVLSVKRGSQLRDYRLTAGRPSEDMIESMLEVWVYDHFPLEVYGKYLQDRQSRRSANPR